MGKIYPKQIKNTIIKIHTPNPLTKGGKILKSKTQMWMVKTITINSLCMKFKKHEPNSLYNTKLYIKYGIVKKRS